MSESASAAESQSSSVITSASRNEVADALDTSSVGGSIQPVSASESAGSSSTENASVTRVATTSETANASDQVSAQLVTTANVLETNSVSDLTAAGSILNASTNEIANPVDQSSFGFVSVPAEDLESDSRILLFLEENSFISLAGPAPLIVHDLIEANSFIAREITEDSCINIVLEANSKIKD